MGKLTRMKYRSTLNWENKILHSCKREVFTMSVANLKRNFQLSMLLPGLTAGLINAIIIISVELSFAALIFSGDLRQFLPRGIGILLLGSFITITFISLTSSLVGMVGVPQDTPAALMALVAAGIATTLKGQDSETIYSTVIGAVILASLLTAVIFIVLGWFKASAFVSRQRRQCLTFISSAGRNTPIAALLMTMSTRSNCLRNSAKASATLAASLTSACVARARRPNWRMALHTASASS
jgi:hypothetical protein